MNIKPKWEALGNSVRGVSHIASNKPNQDAIQIDNTSSMALVAVSDGHGSQKYFRSERGSAIAVKVAQSLLQQCASSLEKATVKDMNYMTAVLGKKLCQCWVDEVNKDIEQHPFSHLEKETLEYYGIALEEGFVVYGATLLASLVTDEYALCFQLGDGDILTVSETGMVERMFPPEESFITNETHSLSEPEAWRHSRVSLLLLDSEFPTLIMLSTDGYSNSFSSDEGFEQVGSDMVSMIKDKGVAYVKENLNEWLKEASANGSRDDVTVGIMSSIKKEAKQNTNFLSL